MKPALYTAVKKVGEASPIYGSEKCRIREQTLIFFYIECKLYKEDKLLFNVETRCCNYLVLEEKCLEYNKEMVEI